VCRDNCVSHLESKVKRPLCIALWAVAAIALVVFLWLAFRQASPGPLALLVVGKTNTLGKPRMILQFTNGTPRDQRIVFVNVERKIANHWGQDNVALETFKPPVLIVPRRSGFLLACDVPESAARRRYTMFCTPEENRIDQFASNIRFLLREDRKIPVEILTTEVEP
jgi:hypothetical protein